VQVHDAPVEAAEAGQRVALNLAGLDRDEIARGDVVVAEGSSVQGTHILDAALRFAPGQEPADGERVQVHHGTRETPGRIHTREDHWQLRLAEPLVAARGDRLVIRRIAPPDTLGGGEVLDPAARRARKGTVPSRSDDRKGSVPNRASLGPEALALEARLREAGAEPPALGPEDREALSALVAAGRVVRVGPLYFHPEAVEQVAEQVRAIAADEGGVTIARLRDELGTSRKYAQALLEHLDAQRVTIRRGDLHVLRRRAAGA
jgi:selenocysteine-specific elongation factor